MLKLMYITNNPEIAEIAENAEVDIIFIDLEIIGKEERQGHLDTVISRHKMEDILDVKRKLKKAQLLVRINPFYEKTKQEVNQAIENGADIIMLPMIKDEIEAKEFIKAVNGRCKTMLLIERKEAVENINEILNVKGIDEIHIGLNDMYLSYKNKFMFEPLVNGTVEKICRIARENNIPYGFGGISRIGTGDLPAEKILIEHYRLQSNKVILSRSFYNMKQQLKSDEIRKIFNEGIKQIREYEKNIQKMSLCELQENRKDIEKIVKKIIEVKIK